MRHETTDLHEAAYMVAEGCQLIDVLEEVRGRVTFTLIGPNIEGLHQNYMNGEAVTNVSLFLDSMNQVKNWMFGVLRAREVREMRIERKRNYARREELKTA